MPINHHEKSRIAEELGELLFEKDVFIPFMKGADIWVERAGGTLHLEPIVVRNMLSRKLNKYKDLVHRINSVMLSLENMQVEFEEENSNDQGKGSNQG